MYNFRRCNNDKRHMDLFRGTPGNTPPSFHITDEAEACAAVLMACLRANELDSDAENAVFNTTIASRNIFIGHNPAVLIAAASKYFEQAGSPAALIEAAAGAIREQTRLPLFFHCLDVMLSDGIVTPLEHKVFLHLKKKFKVEDDLASKALEVLVAKNQL